MLYLRRLRRSLKLETPVRRRRINIGKAAATHRQDTIFASRRQILGGDGIKARRLAGTVIIGIAGAIGCAPTAMMMTISIPQRDLSPERYSVSFSALRSPTRKSSMIMPNPGSMILVGSLIARENTRPSILTQEPILVRMAFGTIADDVHSNQERMMQARLQIHWDGIEPSEHIKARLEKEIASLEKTFGRTTSCEVHFEGPSRRQHKGGLCAARVRIELPGGIQLAASRNPSEDHAHEDPQVAVRDAFRALRKQLRERVRTRREAPQKPDTQPHGLVSKIFPERDYGFIRSDDGRDIYFHRNSVLTGFDRLCIGAEVHFAEDEGAHGPQASSVRAYGVSARST